MIALPPEAQAIVDQCNAWLKRRKRPVVAQASYDYATGRLVFGTHDGRMYELDCDALEELNVNDAEDAAALQKAIGRALGMPWRAG